MAVLTKTQLHTDINADTTLTANQKTTLNNIVDSYEDIFPDVTTVQRDAIVTPANGMIVYNTDNDRYEYWNGVVWFGIGQDLSTPLVVKIDLTSVEIKALFTTPKVVVAAPGAGYALIPNSVVYRYTFGSTAYTFAAGTICLRSGSKTVAELLMEVIALTSITGAGSRSGIYQTNTGVNSDALVENDSLVLQAPTGDPTLGDGTLTLWITYSLVAW